MKSIKVLLVYWHDDTYCYKDAVRIRIQYFLALYLIEYFFDKNREGRLKVISDDLDILLGLDPTYACYS